MTNSLSQKSFCNSVGDEELSNVKRKKVRKQLNYESSNRSNEKFCLSLMDGGRGRVFIVSRMTGWKSRFSYNNLKKPLR